MYKYFIKTPWIVKQLFHNYIWDFSEEEGKNVYLTFDDGPHPVVTPFVLDELQKYKAYATFFCIGDNVQQHPEVYERVLKEGHAVGNHTFNHLNGWKTSTKKYLENIHQASAIIKSNLFRPPYGRITNKQASILKTVIPEGKIIMWDVLSADFDNTISKEDCLNNVMKHTTAGSVIVFHDSDKAFENLKFVLPVVLQKLKEEGYNFKKIEGNSTNN